MVNIAVLDDEAIYIDHIKEITDTCMQQMNLEYRIRVYDEGQNVLDDLENNIYYDIYLLDVRLPDINGLEVAKMLRRRLSEAVLIYITNYVDYAIEAYEVNTFRYIPKLLIGEKLPQAYYSLEVLLKRKKCEFFYSIKRYSGIEKISYRNIYYLKKEKKYIVIVHKDGRSAVRKTMKDILEELQSEEFLLIDRGYAVNIDYVKMIKDYQVYLETGDILPVSKPRRPFVRDALLHGVYGNDTI